MKKYISVDYNLYYKVVLLCMMLIGSAVFIIFLIFGLETEEFSLTTISGLLVIILAASLYFVIAVIRRKRCISKILNTGEEVEAKVLDIDTSGSDCLKLNLQSSDSEFAYSLRVTKKNKDQRIDELSPGSSIRVKYLKENTKKAVIVKYYS